MRLLHLRVLLRHISCSLGLDLSLLSCCLLHILLVGLRLCVCIWHLHTVGAPRYPRAYGHRHRAWSTLDLLGQRSMLWFLGRLTVGGKIY